MPLLGSIYPAQRVILLLGFKQFGTRRITEPPKIATETPFYCPDGWVFPDDSGSRPSLGLAILQIYQLNVFKISRNMSCKKNG